MSEKLHTLQLTDYEWDNLKAALAACSGHHGHSALDVIHNGDWLMQVLYKMDYQLKRYEGRPNHYPEVLVKAANLYIDEYKKWRGVTPTP